MTVYLVFNFLEYEYDSLVNIYATETEAIAAAMACVIAKQWDIKQLRGPGPDTQARFVIERDDYQHVRVEAWDVLDTTLTP